MGKIVWGEDSKWDEIKSSIYHPYLDYWSPHLGGRGDQRYTKGTWRKGHDKYKCWCIEVVIMPPKPKVSMSIQS